MAISLIIPGRIIYIPQADLTEVSGSPTNVFSIDVNFLHNTLRTLMTLEANDIYENTHEHVAPFVLGQITLFRVLKIVGDWVVEFEDTGTPYAVQILGGNTNIDEKAVINNVSVRSFNSAGGQQISTGTSGLTPTEALALLQAVNLMESDQFYDVSTGLLHYYAKGTTVDLITPKNVAGAVGLVDVTIIQP